MRSLFLFVLLSFSFVALSQKTKVHGIVKDAITGEAIIGATIVYAEGKGVATGIEGDFDIALDNGEYTLKVSYVGYKLIEKKITATGKTITLDFPMTTNELSEIEVVADIAIQRETPVAFSNVDSKKIQEELGARDLPLILNSTPGVYATSQGGGDGDARVSIRGFNAQNVLVLLDGIPMNDMVNGRVFWTNWFGLDNLTRGVQVQRGLGATKLAIPAIGGTMNILTASIDAKRSIVVKNEYGNNNNYRIGLSYSSGRLKNGWAFNFAGSYKRNDGWFDHMYSKMWFYYGKVEKKIGSHLIGLQVLGAPQTSAQRDFRVTYGVAGYNKEYAYELGIDTTGKRERGWRYNPSWNFLSKSADGKSAPEVFNTSINKFHKPVFSVKDFITVNEKLNVSTIIYASYGRGYGTQLDGGSAGNNLVYSTGQQDIQGIYNGNTDTDPVTGHYVTSGPSAGKRFSSSWIRENHNDHNWYGALITANYKVHSAINLSGGLDGRLYKGLVYSTIGDLIGGEVVKGINGDLNNPNWGTDNVTKSRGDKYVQNIDRRVRWAGAFAMAEYKKNKWSGFVNVSYAISMYKQYNYFLAKQLKKDGNVIDVPYGTEVVYNGVAYDNNSAELQYNQTGWKQLAGYTAKCGANYNLTEHMNIFANIGYLNRVPFITFVYDNSNKEYDQVNNEKIKSAELGYSYSSQSLSFNVNGYYTIWNNRPTSVSLIDPNDPSNTFNTTAIGMSARHMGIEFDGIYKIIRQVQLEGMVNIADWEWISEATAATYNSDGSLYNQQRVDPRGVKVSDAAQNTFGAAVRYEPIKHLYVKPQFNYFGKNYANLNLNDYAASYKNGVETPNKNVGRQAWRMPDYFLLDVNAGYSMQVWKVKLDLRASVINALNKFYISDAQNNQLNTDFNAAGATVNVGMGRRWQLSLVATF
ncbi:MAG TPA: TonB-dependent receptor [Bacteroidia bacterium]|nr:TonB-dependent receptor [Bacteroidia bacterium]